MKTKRFSLFKVAMEDCFGVLWKLARRILNVLYSKIMMNYVLSTHVLQGESLITF